jgi:putative DNA primase/helicase
MTAAAIIDWTQLAAGDHRVACPSCSRGPRDRTLGVTVDHEGAGVAHCFRCGYVESYRPGHNRQRHHAPLRPQRTVSAPTKRTTLSDAALESWAKCQPLPGTVAEQYLRARGCRPPPVAADALRYHPALRHPVTGYIGPAMVALVTDACTAEPKTLHKTWVLPDGTKPEQASPARMLLGGHEKQGGVIRLWPDEDVTTGLAVGEGIETCLSLAHAFTPVWALIDAGNLAALPVLQGIECLTVAVDHDPAGMAAADQLGERWTAAGRTVQLVRADTPGHDLNDLLGGVAA